MRSGSCKTGPQAEKKRRRRDEEKKRAAKETKGKRREKAGETRLKKKKVRYEIVPVVRMFFFLLSLVSVIFHSLRHAFYSGVN